MFAKGNIAIVNYCNTDHGLPVSEIRVLEDCIRALYHYHVWIKAKNETVSER